MLITREEAISAQLTKYFTGKPCKRGHIAPRYVKSLSCLECLHPNYISVDLEQRKAARIAERESIARSSTLAHLMGRIKVRLHINDVELFESALLGSAICQEPSLRLQHLRTRFVPKFLDSGMMLYQFRCFPQDIETLFALQDSLERARNRTPVASYVVDGERFEFKP